MAQLLRTDAAAKVTWGQQFAALEAQTAARIAKGAGTAKKRYQDSTFIYEDWTNLTTNGWAVGGAVSVGGNKMWGGNGVNKAIVLKPGERMVARWSINLVALGASIFAGVSNKLPVGSTPAAGSDQNGYFVGISGNTASVFTGTSLAASDSNTTPAGNLAAGTYFCTCVVDDTHISMSIQNETGGGILHQRTKRTNLPNQTDGTVLNFGMSCTGTVGQASNSYGPLIIVRGDIAPSPTKTLGGKTLFAATDSGAITINRQDEATNIRHVVRVPGNYDPAVGAPVVLWCHQADTGDADDIINDTRVQPVTNALLNAGYIIVSSDNGVTEGQAPENDRFANITGINDYVSAVNYVRDNFNTQKLFLLGASQGSLFIGNLVGRLELGKITAACSMSGGLIAEAVPYPSVFDDRLYAEYGVADRTAWLAHIAANDLDPGMHPVWQYRGIPMKIVVSQGDTTAPPSTMITPFISRVGPYLAEVDYQEKTGAHFDPSMFVPADVLAFFEKYRY